MIRKYVMGAFALLLALSVAGPVFAEGAFTTSFRGAFVKDESRTWDDRDTDNVGTFIRFTNCSDFTNIGLWRKRLVFDEDVAFRDYDCKGGVDSWNFGRQPADVYFFEIASIGGSTDESITLDIANIYVEY